MGEAARSNREHGVGGDGESAEVMNVSANGGRVGLPSSVSFDATGGGVGEHAAVLHSQVAVVTGGAALNADGACVDEVGWGVEVGVTHPAHVAHPNRY